MMAHHKWYLLRSKRTGKYYIAFKRWDREGHVTVKIQDPRPKFYFDNHTPWVTQLKCYDILHKADCHASVWQHYLLTPEGLGGIL